MEVPAIEAHWLDVSVIHLQCRPDLIKYHTHLIERQSRLLFAHRQRTPHRKEG